MKRARLNKGISCFARSRRPKFIVTGSRDKIMYVQHCRHVSNHIASRLWNPFFLTKNSGAIYGNTHAIVDVAVNDQEGHIISVASNNVCVTSAIPAL